MPSVGACALDPGVDATAAARPELRSRLPFTAVHRAVHWHVPDACSIVYLIYEIKVCDLLYIFVFIYLQDIRDQYDLSHPLYYY